jgi:DNA-binding IclR family transcriptional regulator
MNDHVSDVKLAALLRIARGSMQRVTAGTGETALLTVLNEGKVRYIEKVVSTQKVRYDIELGTSRPLHATSPGLAMLAFLPSETLEQFLAAAPFERMTRNTLVGAARLRQELGVVRKRRYALVSDTHSPGISGVAAPIIDINGKAIAALSVACPTSRFEAVRDRAASEVVREARLISLALSGATSLQGVAQKHAPRRVAKR